MPWLHDRKWAYIRMEGRNFGDVPLNLELKLEVWDSPNSAGVIIDAVRCAKLALDRGIGGPLVGPSAYFMKSPPVQYHDDVAHDLVEQFAAGDPVRSGPPTDRGRRSGALPPPLRQSATGLLLAQRALVHPELEQEIERPAHVTAGGNAERFHHLGAVEVGTDGVELLLLAEDGDAVLELVHPLGQRPGLRRVAAWCSRTWSAR